MYGIIKGIYRLTYLNTFYTLINRKINTFESLNLHWLPSPNNLKGPLTT